jgi:hypothetical protein
MVTGIINQQKKYLFIIKIVTVFELMVNFGFFSILKIMNLKAQISDYHKGLTFFTRLLE